jgi:SAM-dependent methyltransferase
MDALGTRMQSAYNQEFYRTRDASTVYFATRLAKLITGFFAPSSAIDLGCGVGTVLLQLKKIGCSQILGLEGPWVDVSNLVIDQREFRHTDLTRPLEIGEIFDVAMSLEVAEHLDEKHSDTFVDSLCRLSDRIIFGAAIPYQGGVNHLNERWQSYWALKFVDRGYRAFDAIRPALWNDELVPFWYRQNTIVYLKDSVVASYPFLAQFEVTEMSLLDRVHPKLYLRQQTKPEFDASTVPYRQLLKQFPGATCKAIARFIRGRITSG